MHKKAVTCHVIAQPLPCVVFLHVRSETCLQEPPDEGPGPVLEGNVLLPGVDLQGFNSLNGVSCCSEHCVTPQYVECSPLSICCILEGDWMGPAISAFFAKWTLEGFSLPGPVGCLRLEKEPESIVSNHSRVGRERGAKIHQKPLGMGNAK
ncbi:uncharacterized protein LOC144007512 [Festucalex cinctus]